MPHGTSKPTAAGCAIPRIARTCPFVLVVIFACGVPTALFACMWDYDTLMQERSRFPSALELITDKFLRHSPEFYQWRIKDRLERLKSDPQNLALHDDLAVAYQKTGQQAKAIEVVQAKDKIKPGLYETYSNLGTFHILAGDFEKGLPLIGKALAINPKAHFGREKYQKYLVEYALLRRKAGKIAFPLRFEFSRENPDEILNFRDYLSQKLHWERQNELEHAQAAIKGVTGMMRFADHNNPLLLEALGDLLLMYRYDQRDAKQLAARCFLQASYVMQKKDPEAAVRYYVHAQNALDLQVRDSISGGQLALQELEPKFKLELTQAEQWYAKLRDQEVAWIREGKNADTEFDRLYTSEPNVEEPLWVLLSGKLTTGAVGFTALCGFVLWRWKRRRNRVAVTPSI